MLYGLSKSALRARRCASGAARQARGEYRLPYVYRLKKVVFQVGSLGRGESELN